jgi:hypothetical protein
MNAFLKKEIRLLLPTFIGALALAFSLWLIPSESYFRSPVMTAMGSTGKTSLLPILPFLLCPALVLLMTLDSFGREINAGTFSQLLSQPISRGKIWRTKTVLLALAIAIVWAIWWLSFLNNNMSTIFDKVFLNDLKELHEMFITTIIFPFVVFSGGLWTVLLLRQVAAAFWFTLSIPSALALAAMSFAEKFSISVEPAIVTVLAVYSVVGFVFARELFLRGQDVQWTGGIIALPGLRRAAKLKTASVTERIWRPHAALFFKELQLHQSQFVIAGVLALLHLAVIAIREFGDFKDSPSTEFVLNTFWILWFAMPLVVGCAAVAEERKIGTLESQLCLAARRRTQFWIKFLFAMMLSLIFAVAVPLLLEGSRIVPDFHPKFLEALSQVFLKREGAFSAAVGNIISFLRFSMPVLVLLGIATVIAAVSFYASTLSRNTLQSLAPAVLGIVVAFTMLIGASDVGKVLPFVPWRGWLIYLVGIPVMAVVLIALIKWNFKQVGIDWRIARQNVIVLVVALAGVMVLTTAIYHRVWEFLTPLEPAHGQERIPRSVFPSMQAKGDNWLVTVAFPDGKCWQGGFLPYGFQGHDLKRSLIHSEFLHGSNWASIAVVRGENVAIKSDGSLWLMETPQLPAFWHANKAVVLTPESTSLIRIGAETNWQSVIRAGWSPAVLLLKTDGTLWEWGTNQFDFKQKWPLLPSATMRRLGTDFDWSEMISVGSSVYLWKKSGLAWAINPLFQRSKKGRVELDSGIQMERYPELDNARWRKLASGQPFQAGVREDGTLWAWGLGLAINLNSRLSKPRVGTDTNWVSVACEDSIMVALKTDGSLWKWGSSFSYKKKLTPHRLSEHDDWIAIAGRNGIIIGLATDGSLWAWQTESHYSSSLGSIPLLAASRRPLKIGNIFNAPAVH